MLQSVLEVTFLVLLIPLGFCCYRRLLLPNLPWVGGCVLLVLPLNILAAHVLAAALREGQPIADRLGMALANFTNLWGDEQDPRPIPRYPAS